MIEGDMGARIAKRDTYEKFLGTTVSREWNLEAEKRLRLNIQAGEWGDVADVIVGFQLSESLLQYIVDEEGFKDFLWWGICRYQRLTEKFITDNLEHVIFAAIEGNRTGMLDTLPDELMTELKMRS